MQVHINKSQPVRAGSLLIIFFLFSIASGHQQTASRKKRKPNIDDDQLRQISDAIGQSMLDQVQIKITLYDPFLDEELVGVVNKVDQYVKRLKIDDR